MALALYLDDCAYSRLLRDLARAAGHVVFVPADVGLTGSDDDEHFRPASQQGLVLVTKSPADFLTLHNQAGQAGVAHPGVLAIYQDNDPTRDLSNAEIVKAIGNVEAAFGPGGLSNQFIVLNHYRW